jgi:3-phosphoglycerate kinase
VILLGNVRFHLKDEGKYVDLEGIYSQVAIGIENRVRCSMLGEGFNVKCSSGILSKELEAFVNALHLPAKLVLAILRGAPTRRLVP